MSDKARKWVKVEYNVDVWASRRIEKVVRSQGEIGWVCVVPCEIRFHITLFTQNAFLGSLPMNTAFFIEKSNRFPSRIDSSFALYKSRCWHVPYYLLSIKFTRKKQLYSVFRWNNEDTGKLYEGFESDVVWNTFQVKAWNRTWSHDDADCSHVTV